jgi:hypothetical protein
MRSLRLSCKSVITCCCRLFDVDEAGLAALPLAASLVTVNLNPSSRVISAGPSNLRPIQHTYLGNEFSGQSEKDGVT